MEFSHTAYLALGANLGQRLSTLKRAIEAIEAMAGIKVTQVSRLYQTSPVDSSGPDYINAVIEVRTSLSPMALLDFCQSIETSFGRVRPQGVHNAPRTLDIDILLYDRQHSDDPRLVLPHPRMTQRLFVMMPLRDIAPQWEDEKGKSVGDWIKEIESIDPSQKIKPVDENCML